MASEKAQPILSPIYRPVEVHKSKQWGLHRSGRQLRPGLPQFRVHVWVRLLAVVLFAAIQSCASVPKRNPVPEELSRTAQIPDIPYARIWGDELPHDLENRLAVGKAQIETHNPDALRQPHTYLALSGGGANGAFGAGLLAGWTEAGNRPNFNIVTGVSTGSLIAPLAFLGPAYDAKLKRFYTTVSTEDILKRRNVLAAVTGDALASTEPLQKLMTEIYDQKMLKEIAVEYGKGRRLWIGTTNLDADRPVIWNIGAIATKGDSKALELFQKVLLASASIPGAFPPVYIEVEANGRRYDEMHVDGGATTQVFLYPASLDWRQVAKKLGLKGETRIYVIRNSRLEPEWEAVKPTLGPIAKRSISTLIRTQGIGDLYRIYLGAQRDNIDYNLAYIPEDFEAQPKEEFDPEYMKKLFDLGYHLAKSGYPWKKAPPGFAPP